MHKRLEMSVDEYLEEVTTQLGSLPANRREDELREMSQHLDEAVTNSRKQGLSEEQAVAAALTRFGTPQEAAETAIWAWRDHVRRAWRHFSVRYLAIWGFAVIWNSFQFFSSISQPHNGLQYSRGKIDFFLFGSCMFIYFLPLLLALLLHLPRKYQPGDWVYRLLSTVR